MYTTGGKARTVELDAGVGCEGVDIIDSDIATLRRRKPSFWGEKKPIINNYIDFYEKQAFKHFKINRKLEIFKYKMYL